MLLPAQVVRVVPATKMKTAFSSFKASRYTVGLVKAMLIADPCVYTPGVNITPPISPVAINCPKLPLFVKPEVKAASPSAAQLVASIGAESKLPVIDVPGETPILPWI